MYTKNTSQATNECGKHIVNLNFPFECIFSVFLSDFMTRLTICLSSSNIRSTISGFVQRLNYLKSGQLLACQPHRVLVEMFMKIVDLQTNVQIIISCVTYNAYSQFKMFTGSSTFDAKCFFILFFNNIMMCFKEVFTNIIFIF